MSLIKKLIKQLIEEQNDLELEKILNENPEIDLNNFTSNNISALWLALSPTPPKLPSYKIISLLIERNKIDPSQIYSGQTIRSYYGQQFNYEAKIRRLLICYENRFNARQNNVIAEGDQRLRAFANHQQNVHSAVVEDSVKKSAANLFQRYIKKAEFNYLIPLRDLELWLDLDGYNLNLEAPAEKNIDENTLYFTIKNKSLFYTCIDAQTKQKITAAVLPQIHWRSPLTAEQLKPHFSDITKAIKKQGTSLKSLGLNIYSATKSFNRIKTLDVAYKCSSEISLNGQQAMALAWLGISSLNSVDFVENIDMSSNEIRERKRLFVETLINIQNEYGINVTSCEGGTFNILISRLDCIHVDVKISESTTLNQELISHKYMAFCKNTLETLLAKDSELFWNYMKYYPFGDLPVGLENAKFPQEIIKKISDFNENAFAEFIKQIKKENKDLQEEDERTDRKPAKHMKENNLELVLNNLTFILNDSGLAIGNLSRLTKMIYFYQKINTFTTNCFGFGSEIQNQSIKAHMNLVFAAIISKNPANLDQIFDDLGTALANYPVELFALEKHLYPLSESYGNFFDNLESSRKGNLLQQFWSIYAKNLPRTQIDNKDESIFWALLKQDLLNDFPLLEEWFNSLPEDLAKEFINVLNPKKLSFSLPKLFLRNSWVSFKSSLNRRTISTFSFG